MSITRPLSHLDTYFFLGIAIRALLEHGGCIDEAVRVVLGEAWRRDVEARALAFRAAVERLLLEEAETRGARDEQRELLGRLPAWRRAMEAWAWIASKAAQPRLLRAAGRGLGSPRSVKEHKDFWVEVEQRVAVEKEAFVALGVPAALLSTPTGMRLALEERTRKLAKERAEDRQSLARLREARALVDEDFRVLGHALNATKATAELLADKAALDGACVLEAHLSAALGEARVQTRKRVAAGEAPAALAGVDVEHDGNDDGNDDGKDDVEDDAQGPGGVEPA